MLSKELEYITADELKISTEKLDFVFKLLLGLIQMLKQELMGIAYCVRELLLGVLRE